MQFFNCAVCRREGQGKALVDAVTLETLKVPDRDAERELVDAVNEASPECVRPPRHPDAPARAAAAAAAAAAAPHRATPAARVRRCASALLREADARNASRPRRLLRDVVRRFRVKLEQPDPHVQLLALQARAAARALAARLLA